MDERKNIVSLEIKEIDLSLSEDFKAYLDWLEFMRETCLSFCGIPNEHNSK
jgi:hypothetical protein